MLFIIISLVLVILVNLVLSGMIYHKNHSLKSNLYFVIFLFFTAFWALGDVLLLYHKTELWANIGVYLFLLAPVVTTHFVVLFSEIFPSGSNVGKLKKYIYSVGSFAVAVAIVTNANWVAYVEITDLGMQNVLHASKPGFVLYGLYFNVYFLIVYINMFRKLRRNHGRVRAQIFYSMVGILLSSFLAVTTNTALPNYFGNSGFIWLGPVFTLILSILTSYAILKHRLFDVRLVIARSTAYVSIIASIVTLYIVIGAVVTRLFIGSSVSSRVQLVYMIFALLIASIYGPVKRFFDRLTSQIFYRDAYDSAQILESSSNVLATEIDLDIIISRTAKLIVSSLRPEYIRFVVFDDNNVFKDFELGPSKSKKVAYELIDSVQEDIISYDSAAKNQKILKKYEADMMMKLTNNNELIGFVMLGKKQSGSTYSKQDMSVMQIVVRELAVAVDNARKYEQIQAFNITLQKEVERATKRLKKSNEELKQLDKTKDEFVSMASHQLRTPLTSIKGYLSMIVEGDVGKVSKDQKKLLKEAYASSERMVYLIADLLNVSRLQAGTFVIDRTVVHLPSVIRDEINQLREVAKSRNIKLEYTESKNFPEVLLDETKTRQVLMNFIDNALYYTPNGGKITVKLIHTKHQLEFTVRDTGIGVPKEAQKHLFDKFFRADNAKKARPDGTGIGLFMAKKVIVAQGGAILFKTTEGKGSIFGFTLPMEKIKLNKQGKAKKK